MSRTATPQAPAAPARAVRLIHTALVMGVLLFAVVVQFVLRPTLVGSTELPPLVVTVLVGSAFVACALSLVFRQRVPRRSADESADLFWTRATAPAIRVWALLEGASLLAVYVYARTGAPAPVGVALVAVALFIVLNPAYLEKP
jgi:hypothetical protein